MAGKRSRAIRRTSSVSAISTEESHTPNDSTINTEGMQSHQGSLEAVYVDSGCCTDNINHGFRSDNTGVPAAAEQLSSCLGQHGGRHSGTLWVSNAVAVEHKRHSSSNGRNVRPHDKRFQVPSSGQHSSAAQDGTGLNLLAALRIEETTQANGELQGLPPLPPCLVTNTASPAHPGYQQVYGSRQMQSTGFAKSSLLVVNARQDGYSRDWQEQQRKEQGREDLICQTSPWSYGTSSGSDGEELECDWWEPPTESLAGADGQGFGYFLDSCGYCSKALNKDHDIYMYGGDRAFCSDECRQHQIHLDERPQRQCFKTALRMDLTRRNGQPVVQRRTMVGSAA